MKPKQSARSERGVSALEFTILAPLVFVFVFGMIEFGCLFYDKALITNASREGARVGIVFVPDHNTVADNIQARVTAAITKYLRKEDDSGWRLIYFGSSTPAPTIPTPTINAGTNGSNDRLRVEVRWTYDFLVLPNFKDLGWVDLDSTITLNAVSEMMLQENPA